MKNQVILVDCDGVLLDWEAAFDAWMSEHGYKMNPGGSDEYLMYRRYPISPAESRQLIRTFNESAAIGFLKPLRDAQWYVRRLHEEHGYVFHCITSLSRDPNARRLREMSLNKIFGKSAFEKIICLGTGDDKDGILGSDYKDTGCWWIEDKPENAEVGYNLGLRSVLMKHNHNEDFLHVDIPKVHTWREIYHMIIKEKK